MRISDWSSDVCSSDLYVQDIDVKAGGSSFEIPVTDEWERHDVYVTALVFRGGSEPSKITPARAVGVAWVPMDRKASPVAVGLKATEPMSTERPLRGSVRARGRGGVRRSPQGAERGE